MALEATGYVLTTLDEVLTATEQDQLATVQSDLDLSPDQALGQINGIFAKKIAEAYELAALLADAMNPNAAENFLLDNIALLTGTVRLPSTRSTVTINCTLGVGFSAVADAMTVNQPGQPSLLWRNVAAVPVVAVAGVVAVKFQAVDYGPIAANANTLTVITNPLAGWTLATNPLDATQGTLTETDAALRARRETELTKRGASTVDSIRVDVLAVAGVKQCYVFENVTLATDSDGLPGKAIEVVVYDGNTPLASDADIGLAIWNSKPSGCETFGTTSVNVTDGTGTLRTVKFSRAIVKQVWLEYDVTVYSQNFPVNGATLIKEAVTAYGTSFLNLGTDVFSVAFKAQALTVAGVLDVPALRLGFAAVPTGTANLTITGREIAAFDTSRIIVNVTSGSP